jgi:hypothetical protein
MYGSEKERGRKTPAVYRESDGLASKETRLADQTAL